MNKHFTGKQNEQLSKENKVNTILIPEALLTSKHTPIYLKSLEYKGEIETYLVRDELGFEAEFAKGTEILVWSSSNNCASFIKVEQLKEGMERVINFELNHELADTKFKHKFLSICSNNVQQAMCDGINSNLILKKINDTTIKKYCEFDSKNNVQEVHLAKIEEVRMIDLSCCYEMSFLPFKYILKKDKTINKTDYSSKINKLRGKKYLDKMRKNVYNIKKDKYKIGLELVNENNNH